MHTLSELEAFLKNKKNTGQSLPEVRFFDGINKFSTPEGEYSSDSLSGSLELFMEKGVLNNKR